MVEHRTENSGVGGSNPFIGRIKVYFLKNLINKNFLFYQRLCIIPTYYKYFAYKIILLQNFFYFFVEKPKFFYKYRKIQILQRVKTQPISNPYKFYRKRFWWKHFLKPSFLQQQKLKPISSRLWFFLYLQLYIWNFSGYNFSWYFLNFDKSIKNSPFVFWWYQINSYKIFKNFFHKKKFFYYNILNLFFFKKPFRLVRIISEIISLAPLKRHKKHFYQVKKILSTIFRILKNNGCFLGYSIFFKGKLGRKGSVKKSTFFYKLGRVSITNKSLRINYKKYLIHTETGVVGCGISMFFNKMFTYMLLYVLVYFFLSILFFIFLLYYINFTNLQEWNLSSLVGFILNYSSFSKQFLLLFLTFSGLPPVIFFLIKLSFLLKFFATTNFVIQILLFFNFLSGMFFYLQIFNTTLTNKPQTLFLSQLSNYNFGVLFKKNTCVQLRVYKLWYYFSFCLVMNFFSIFFFFDLYIIFYVFFI